MNDPNFSTVHPEGIVGADFYLIIFVCCASLVLAVLIAIVMGLWLQSRRSAIRAQTALDPAAKLGSGPATVAGEVQYANEASGAVTVEIAQYGFETTVDGECVSHSWTEVDRTVTAAPFYLRLETGERVRVEPSEDPFVVCPLAGFVYVDDPERDGYAVGAKRARVAKLSSGEHVIAQGVLHWDADPEVIPGGYRTPRMGWVLRPPAQEPMLLSSEPLEDRFLRSQRYIAGALRGLFAIFVSVQALFVSFYYGGWFLCVLEASQRQAVWAAVAFVCVAIGVHGNEGTNGTIPARRWYESSELNDSGEGSLDPRTGRWPWFPLMVRAFPAA